MTDHDIESPARRSMVHIIMDPADSAAITHAALNAHNPAAGRIVLHPTPATKSLHALTYDLLAALGKPIENRSEEKIKITLLHQTVLAWLSGESHQEIIILRSHLMNEQRWTTLLDIHRITGIQVIFIYHALKLSTTHERLLSNVPHQITYDIYEFLRPVYGGEHFERPRHAESSPSLHSLTLPSVDFPRFRAEIFRRLSAEEFAAVDAEYAHGIETACQWLSAHDDYRKNTTPNTTSSGDTLPPLLTPQEFTIRAATLGQHYTEEEIKSLSQGLLCLGRAPRIANEFPYTWRDRAGLQTFLSDLVTTAPSPNHTITRIRGAQAGFLLHGLLLSVPAELELHPGPGISTPLTPELADHIRRSIVHPQRAAALACALLTHLGHDLLYNVPISALSRSGHQLRINDQRCFSIPPHVRGLLRAARSFAQLHGFNTPDRKLLLAPGVGRSGQHLQASAAVCEIELLAHILKNYATDCNCWHHHIRCWWIASPLHGPIPDHESHNRNPPTQWNLFSHPSTSI